MLSLPEKKAEVCEYLSILYNQYLEIDIMTLAKEKMSERYIALSKKQEAVDSELEDLKTQKLSLPEKVSEPKKGCSSVIAIFLIIVGVLCFFTKDVSMIIFGILLIFVTGVILIMGHESFKIDKENYLKYQRTVRIIQEHNEQLPKRVERKENELKKVSAQIKFVVSEIRSYNDSLKKAESVLKDMLNLGVVHPRYHTKDYIAYLIDYVTSRQNPNWDDAYNNLDSEIRADRIVNRLDTISHQLTVINNSIAQLGMSIITSQKEIDRRINSLVASSESLVNSIQDGNANLQRIAEQSEINNYTSKRIEEEIHYMNRMNYLCGRNDGPYHNVPPRFSDFRN